MSAKAATCPPADDWSPLLLGDRVGGGDRGALLAHLLRPCPRCWRRLARLVAAWDASLLPLDNAPSMALHSAAAGMAGRPHGRLALMRPLHRRDAFQASSDRLAFCRLLLHEALAASLRSSVDGPPGSFVEARLLLADPCATTLSDPQRHDLEAFLAIYQAYERLLRHDEATAQSLMVAAEESLRRGEGLAEPRVTWWTFQAATARLLALRREDPAPRLRSAASHLRQALQDLPVESHAEQRAELLHDLATLEMQLGEIASARRLLARADTLLQRLGEVAGPYLRSIVWVAQSQAEARWAKTLHDGAAKHASRQRAGELFDCAVQLGFLDSADLAPDRRQLKALLVP